MLMRSDPFGALTRFTQPFGNFGPLTVMPMDVYRQGDEFVAHIDLPGVDPSSVEVTVEHGTLSITAERSWQPEDGVRVLKSERPQGSFSRQVFLGEGLDADRVQANYDRGVLTVRAPISDHAKTRKVEIRSGDQSRELHSSNN